MEVRGVEREERVERVEEVEGGKVVEVVVSGVIVGSEGMSVSESV